MAISDPKTLTPPAAAKAAVLPRRAWKLLLLLAAEMALLEATFQLLPELECAATGAEGVCLALRGLFARGLAAVAMLAVLAWARPAGIVALGEAATARGSAFPWPVLHFAGVLLLFLPAVFLSGRAAPEFFALALAPWLAGAALAAVGALGWYAPFRAWWRWLVAERFLPLVLLAVASVLPNVIVWVQPIWHWSTLAATTFAAVEFLLMLFGQATVSDPSAYIIGIDDFIVEISRQCAGIEGFVLVTAFLGLYAFLFRSDTRLPRFWLLLPVALLLSWAFNVVRITTLILIGAHVSPALAVNGFHSYAGWIFFTILALTILVVARRLAWLRVRPADASEVAAPLRDDWNAARVLPFVAFMAASMIGSALFENPDAAYPLKAAVMALALLPFAHFYRAIDWRLDPAALAAGLAVAALWVAPTILGLEASGTASAAPSVAWMLVRLAGTILLVPLIEELFFRDYLLERFDVGGRWGTLVAVALSTAVFAALHGRWLLAVAAGLVFCSLRLRRGGRLADAVLCHVVANAGVAAVALATGNWQLI